MPARKAPKKKAYHHGDLRRALLAEALNLVAREGTGAVSLRELAERVGVSHAAPYRHFHDKEALFAAVAEEGFRLLQDAEERARDEAGAEAGARLEGIGVGYVRFAVGHPGHFKVMFSHIGSPPDDGSDVATAGRTAFEVLFHGIQEAQGAGVVAPGDIMQQALFAWAGVHGLACLLVEGVLARIGPAEPPELQARRIARLLIGAVAVR